MRTFLRAVVLKAVYPALMISASFLRGKRERFQSLVIRMNNRLVRSQWERLRADGAVTGRKVRVLLLLPHCLQVNECDVRITHNVYKCKRCGRCEIKDLIEISEEKNLDLFVATGGSVARRIVHEGRPDAVVAIACERDLSSGIVDSFPMPVLGILNERPCGPCINTRVDLARVREALDFLGGK
ncbi:MAG: DUF116 domain-containing protein [Chloroflexota bacterium]